MAKKYVSIIKRGSENIYVKDAEAIKDVFTSSAKGAAPAASSTNLTSAETSATRYYLCDDGKYRKLPANAFLNTDTSVTAVGNHYAPSAEGTAELTAAISGEAGAYAKNTEYIVLTGVKAQRDAKGHVTGLTYTAQTVKDTNTTYSAGTTAQLDTGTDTSNRVWPAKQIADYVKGMVANATHFKGTFNASNGKIDGGSSTLTSVANAIGDVYACDTAGTLYGTTFEIGDSIIFKKAVAAGTAPVATDIVTVEGTVSVSNGSADLAWGQDITVGTVEGVNITAKLPSNPNTHYTAVPVAGGSTATSNATSDTSNPYINIVENSAKSGGIQLQGGGATSVTAKNGVVTISSTDASVTAVDNHYTPTANDASEITGTVTGTVGSYAKDTEYTVLTGVKAQRDAKGHVTGLTYTAQKIKDTNTTYSVNNGTYSIKTKVGTTVTTASDFTANQSSADDVTFIQGSNVTLTTDTTNRTITIAATDTTYESKAAASGGTDVSLVTTGEKATWNAKTSNAGTVTKVTAGAGLSGGDITSTGTVKANLVSETKLTNAAAAATETSGRVYPVALDKDGKLAVNVPWTNVNGSYLTSSSTLNAAKLSGTVPAGCYTNTTYDVVDGTDDGLAPSTKAANVAAAESSSSVNYLCSDGKWRPLPAGAWKTGTSTSDTKNTAGTTNKASTKMFLVAATSQAANPQTYSNVNCYIGTDNQLYSNGTAVLTGAYASSAEAITAATELT